MNLIDRDEAIKALTPPEYGKYKHLRQIIRELPTVDAIPMEVLNKINELVLEGYTVCFKLYPGDYISIEVTYDRVYHANHMLTHLDYIKPEHVSDCIVMILDDLKHKIQQLKEDRKQHEIV